MNVILGPVVQATEESLAILRSPRIVLRDTVYLVLKELKS